MGAWIEPTWVTVLLSRLFKRNTHDDVARRLYVEIVAQARQPAFYRDCGVPDTLDGRFEMIALHAFLVLHRLKHEPDSKEGAALGQGLFDILFGDMDASLREIGVGDLGVGRRVRTMAEALYGRIAAYEAGLDGAPEDMAAALGRNLYGTVEPDERGPRAMAGYLAREAESLAAQEIGALMAGQVAFGPPPAP